MLNAVGIDAELDHVGAELPQGLRRHLVGCAVGAVDDDAEAVEAEVLGQRALGEFDVALARAVDAGRAWPIFSGAASRSVMSPSISSSI